MESFLVGLLFTSVIVFIWALCLGAFGLIALPVLFVGTICCALIAISG